MYWTIQNKIVLDEIEKKGVYRPNFSKYPEQMKYPDMYKFIRSCFNVLNPELPTVDGVVFAFDRPMEQPLKSFDEVKDALRCENWRNLIQKGGKNEDLFESDEYYLLELDGYPDNMNALPMDICIFVYMGDGFSSVRQGRRLHAKHAECINEIRDQLISAWNYNMFLGWLDNNCETNMLQLHLPYIKKENIMKAWPISSLN